MPSDGKSKLELERYLAGELTPEQEQALRMRVGDDALRALVAQHASESEALFAELPPARFRAQVEARALPVRRGPRLMLAAPVLIAALTLLFWVRTPEGKIEHDPGAEQTRRKFFDMASADKLPVVGYHFPFPSAGYVEKNGNGYRLVQVHALG